MAGGGVGDDFGRATGVGEATVTIGAGVGDVFGCATGVGEATGVTTGAGVGDVFGRATGVGEATGVMVGAVVGDVFGRATGVGGAGEADATGLARLAVTFVNSSVTRCNMPGPLTTVVSLTTPVPGTNHRSTFIDMSDESSH
jgi:hypothetical protein